VIMRLKQMYIDAQIQVGPIVKEMRYLQSLSALILEESDRKEVHEKWALNERIIMHLDPANIPANFQNQTSTHPDSIGPCSVVDAE